MKRKRIIICSFLVIIFICGLLFIPMLKSDDPEVSPESTGTAEEYIGVSITPAYEFDIIGELNAVIVEWGEIIEDLIHYESVPVYEEDENGKSVLTSWTPLECVGIKVNYIKQFEVTTSERNLVGVHSKARRNNLQKTYPDEAEDDPDDVFMIPKYYAEYIKKGDAALLFLDKNGTISESSVTNIYVSGYYTDNIAVIPFRDGKISVPESAEALYQVKCLREKEEKLGNLKVFRSGMTTKDLEEYFNYMAG